MTKTLKTLALAGLSALSVSCHQPREYPAVYADVCGNRKLDIISLQMDNFYNWHNGKHEQGVEFPNLDNRPYHVDYVFYVACNKGDGSFEPKKEVLRDHNSGADAAIRDFTVKDLDGDGKADLVYTVWGNKTMFAKGRGNGTFDYPRRAQ
ncbi:MAG: VCBS repeat-containing protein [Candidatus Pacearchaeota archaeon]|jgi:hypothetical protein